MKRWALLFVLLLGRAGAPGTLPLPPIWPSAEVAQRGGQERASPSLSLEEHGQFSRWSGEMPAAIRIVSYNIQLGQKLEQILALFRTHPELSRTDVLALQEVVRDRHASHARVLAERLGFDYVYLPGKRKGDREIGLALLSRYPLRDVERLVIPQERRRDDLARVALGATLAIGTTKIRLYNVHVQALAPVELKIRQIEAVLQSALRGTTPYRLIVGDFNTLTRKDRRALDRLLREAGFFPALPGSAWTYRRLLIRMTLDWIYVQNLRVLGSGVTQEVTASDHRPIWVDVALPFSTNEERRAHDPPRLLPSPFCDEIGRARESPNGSSRRDETGGGRDGTASPARMRSSICSVSEKEVVVSPMGLEEARVQAMASDRARISVGFRIPHLYAEGCDCRTSGGPRCRDLD